MIPGVIGRLVTRFNQGLVGFWETDHIATDTKEGGQGTVFFQNINNLQGDGFRRPIVKSEVNNRFVSALIPEQVARKGL